MSLGEIIKERKVVFDLLATEVRNIMTELSSRSVKIDEDMERKIKRLAGSLQVLQKGIPALQASIMRAKTDRKTTREFLAALTSERQKMEQLTRNLGKVLTDQSSSILDGITRKVRELGEILIGHEQRVRKIK